MIVVVFVLGLLAGGAAGFIAAMLVGSRHRLGEAAAAYELRLRQINSIAVDPDPLPGPGTWRHVLNTRPDVDDVDNDNEDDGPPRYTSGGRR